jgi:hypothetical protein
LVHSPALQTPSVPPQPAIHKFTHAEMLRLFHDNPPSEIRRYFELTPVMMRMIFSDMSVLDDKLLGSISRAPPDIHVAFFATILEMVKKAGEFFQSCLPKLSQFATHPILISQISDPDFSYSTFFEYYLNCLDQFANLLGHTNCKVIYATPDADNLIFPTETFSHVITTDDSLCGLLLHRSPQRISAPNKDPAFEIIGEGPVFEGYEFVVSSTFASGSATPQGLVILLGHKQFTDRDEIMLTALTAYFGPLLALFRSLFLKITPAHFAIVSRAIARLQLETWSEQFRNEVCVIASAGCCRMFSTSKPYPGIPELPQEDSLILKAVSQRTPCAYKLPRRRPDFNRAVDDDPSLPRITSMMILPVNNTPLVVVLYNSTIASQFTPLQISVADIFGMSLPPILKQISMAQEMATMTLVHAKGIEASESIVHLIPEFVKAIKEDRLFDAIQHVSPSSVKCFLFFLTSADEAIRYPDGCLVELSENLRRTEPVFTANEVDLAVDVAGDEEIQTVLVIRARDCVCLFGASDLSAGDQSFLVPLGGILLFLIPWVHVKQSVESAFRSCQDIRAATRGSSQALSRLVNFPVKCEFYDPAIHTEPETDALVQVCVETSKGIEAILTAETQDESIVEFGGLLSSGLMHRPALEAIPQVADVLLKSGMAMVFHCQAPDISQWISRVSHLVVCKNPEPLIFLQKIISSDCWNDWFDEQARLLILLAAFLRGIEKKWQCQASKTAVERLMMAKRSSLPILGAVFSPNFGIADGLDDVTIENLVRQLDGLIVPSTVSAEGHVVSQLKFMSSHSFQLTDVNRICLGQTFVLFARVSHFTANPSTLAQRLLELYGREGRAAELFRVERIYIPIMLSLSQRDDQIMKLGSLVREGLSAARKAQ